jgi:hypothetical protein
VGHEASESAYAKGLSARRDGAWFWNGDRSGREIDREGRWLGSGDGSGVELVWIEVLFFSLLPRLRGRRAGDEGS